MLTAALLAIGSGCISNSQLQKQQTTYKRLNVVEQQLARLSRESINSQQKLNADTNIRMDNLERELKLLSEALEDNLARPEEIKTTNKFEFESTIARLEKRLQKLEKSPLATRVPEIKKKPSPSIIPLPQTTVTTPLAGTREKALYDDAYATFKRGNIKTAKDKFKKFIASFPDSTYKVNAMLWVGECFYKTKDYAEAIIKYDEIIANHPHHPKAASALLKQGFAFLKLGDTTDGKLLLEKVIANYPESDPAEIARRKLKNIN